MTLEVKHGCFSYGAQRVLNDVNLKVDSCDIVAILGRNGIGKTTLLKCIMGMLPWQSGGAYLDGVDIRTIPQRQLWRDVAYVPQAKNAFDYPVRDMIVMGRSSHIGTFGKPSAADYEIADSIVERLGIQSFAHKSCTQLSGGQLQLVLIGRALASEPKILIMDEPESNLDYHNQLHVLDLVTEIAKTTACVLNTHYPDHALRYANKAFMLLPTGEGIMGTTQEVITQDHLQKAFHINVHVGQTQIADAYYPYIIPLHTHIGVGV